MMESIEKLRTFARNMAKGSYLVNHEECNLLLIIADEIEAEIERDYMKLPEEWTAEQAGEIIGYWPKWDDGQPCVFGDRFTTPKYAFEENAETFDRLVIYARDHVFKHADGTPYEGEHGGYYEWNYFRPSGEGCEEYRPHHYVPQRTIEDVLVDMLEAAVGYSDAHTEVSLVAVEKYADEIRELMEVDDGLSD